MVVALVNMLEYSCKKIDARSHLKGNKFHQKLLSASRKGGAAAAFI